jgi:hypothetical protein
VNIIGIVGKAGSGKDWLGANALRPAGYRRFSLAWHMKNEAVGGIGVRQDFGGPRLVWPTWEQAHETKPPHIREWLQVRGTENGWMKYGRDYWIRILEAWLTTLEREGYLDDAAGIFVPDVRFPHEVEWVRARGGKLVKLVGRGGLAGAAGQHSSETALDHLDDDAFDVVLDNSPEAGLTPLRALVALEATGVVQTRARLERWPQPDDVLCL